MSDYENPMKISADNIGRPVHLIQKNKVTLQPSSITGFLNAVSEVLTFDSENIRSLHIGNTIFTVTDEDQIRFINLPKREQ